MRVLLLTFYFPPDLSAGSFRSRALAKALSDELGPGDEVHVVTSKPNRYDTFDAQAPDRESKENLLITRFSVPEHHSGMADQAWSYVSYVSSVLREVGGGAEEEYDLVYATSSRLMTGALGAMVANRLGAPLYLDIRDLFPINISELFGGKPQKAVVPFLRLLERWTLRNASRVSVVSPGFLDYLRSIRDDLDYRIFTNGIDQEFLEFDYHASRGSQGGRKVIVYAGNIGEGQGLEHVVPGAAERLEHDYEFWIVGDGGRRRKLERELEIMDSPNVRVLDPVPREKLLNLYAQADVLFVHLNDYEAFRRVLPSKVFECAATGKPLLAGVEGVSRKFIVRHISNASVFSPCDVNGLIQALEELEMKTEDRDEFVERFRRAAIANEMAADVIDLARAGTAGTRREDAESGR